MVILWMTVISASAQDIHFDSPNNNSKKSNDRSGRPSTQLKARQNTTIADIERVTYQTAFATTAWPDQLLNFNPDGIGIYSGDINGDGINDRIQSYSNVFNLQTEDPSDIVNRSLIFYGGNGHQLQPDETVDAYLYPTGDMNGDGYDDALGVNFDQSVSFFAGSAAGFNAAANTSDLSLATEVVGFNDFNGDGYADVLTYQSFDFETYSITFGNAEATAFVQLSYQVTNPRSVIIPLQHGDHHLLYELWANEEDEIQYQAWSFLTGERASTPTFDGTLISTTNAPDSPFINVNRANLNGDEYDDLISISNYSGLNTILNLGSTNGLSSQYQVLDPTADWMPIGDFNNDQLDDLIQVDGNNNVGPIGLTSFSTEVSIQQLPFTANFEIDPSNPPGYRRPIRFGDLNGDGFDDLQFAISQPEGKGNLILYGNNAGTFDQTSEVIYPEETYQMDEIFRSSVTLEDFDGDNVNDLATLYRDRIEIFTQTALSGTPDFVIAAETKEEFYHLIAGDFNDDGLSDIVVSVTVETGERSYRRELRIYYGSRSFDGSLGYRLRDDDIDIPGSAILTMENIGDFNNDGVEDFAVTSFPGAVNYIYLGGNTFQKAPHLAINLTNAGSPDDMDSSNPFNFGYNVNGVGDINGDGIDDLVISDTNRRLRSEDGSNFTMNGAGVLFVLFGETFERDTPPTIEPDAILFQRELAFNLEGFVRFGWSVTGADLNGDGENDLIVMPRESKATQDPASGADFIFVYHGGPDFDEIADASFKLPTAPFEGNSEFFGDDFSGSLTAIPDLDGDGADEVLIGSSAGYANAALYMGGAQSDMKADAIFDSPNRVSYLGVFNNFVNIQFNNAIGDFNNDGELEIVLPQERDRNFKGGAVYTFPLVVPSQRTQSITFDPIEDQSTSAISFELNATSSSGLPITYEVEGPATLDGNTLLLDRTVGTVTITSSQEGDDTFFAATPVERTFDVLVITSSAEDVADKVIAFPNPTRDQVTIRSKLFGTGVQNSIRILNMSGQLIQEIDDIHQRGNELTISLNGLQKGIYLLDIQSGQERSLIRLVKRE